ncbi:MAG: hypothetical protein R3F34_05795 [Planctomycetota bacterium]
MREHADLDGGGEGVERTVEPRRSSNECFTSAVASMYAKKA